MKIETIKREMLDFRDYYGQCLLGAVTIERATTKKELADVLEGHRNYMRDQLSDANTDLDWFIKKLGLNP